MGNATLHEGLRTMPDLIHPTVCLVNMESIRIQILDSLPDNDSAVYIVNLPPLPNVFHSILTERRSMLQKQPMSGRFDFKIGQKATMNIYFTKHN